LKVITCVGVHMSDTPSIRRVSVIEDNVFNFFSLKNLSECRVYFYGLFQFLVIDKVSCCFSFIVSTLCEIEFAWCCGIQILLKYLCVCTVRGINICCRNPDQNRENPQFCDFTHPYRSGSWIESCESKIPAKSHENMKWTWNRAIRYDSNNRGFELFMFKLCDMFYV